MSKRKASEIVEELQTASFLLDCEDYAFERRYILEPEAFELYYLPSPNARKLDIDYRSGSFLKPGELAVCLDLLQSWTTECKGDPSEREPKVLKKALKAKLRAKTARYLIVRPYTPFNMKKIEAYLRFELVDTERGLELMIHDLHLRESMRYLGLGAYLVRTVETIARRIGIEMITLTHPEAADRAHGFFKRLGYTRDWIPDTNEEGEGAVRMRKLSAPEPASRPALHEMAESERNDVTAANSASAPKKAKLSAMSHCLDNDDTMVHLSVKLGRIGRNSGADPETSPRTARRIYIDIVLDSVGRKLESQTQSFVDEGKLLNSCEVSIVSGNGDP